MTLINAEARGQCSNRRRVSNKRMVSIKACAHCRRKVRQSPNFAVVSPFSATVALFCDSVDRALNAGVSWSCSDKLRERLVYYRSFIADACFKPASSLQYRYDTNGHQS